MGRQSAGASFLRAAVHASKDGVLIGCGPNAKGAHTFEAVVKDIDPTRRTAWIVSDDLHAFAEIGAIHLPDPSLAEQASLRINVGSAAYSITSITHTLSSLSAMRMLAEIPLAPAMPWDGLICTSHAVRSVIIQIFAAQDDYAKWKFGCSNRLQRPEMPVIPLGVHVDDFTSTEAFRGRRRADLGIGEDDVVFLFLGRLSFHAKAHPFPMYRALEDVARESGKRLVLIQCGWFANEFIEKAFKDGADEFSPSVKHIWLDGRKDADRKTAWAICDVFISLSDNIQETFGLTLIEAMAAGKPVVATDWDGYRDIIKPGVTGFLVPTMMPEGAIGNDLALKHAAGALSYDHYIGLCSQWISLDHRFLQTAIVRLAQDAGLRQRMGEAGRSHAKNVFDWKVVFQQYTDLWSELHRKRLNVGSESRAHLRGNMANQLAPFQLFSSYPTSRISGKSLVRLSQTRHSARELLGHPLFSLAANLNLRPDVIDRIIAILDDEGTAISVSILEWQFPDAADSLMKALALLAKMAIIEIEPEDAKGVDSRDGLLRTGGEHVSAALPSFDQMNSGILQDGEAPGQIEQAATQPSSSDRELGHDAPTFHRRVAEKIVWGLKRPHEPADDLMGLNESLRLLAKWRSVMLQQTWVKCEGNRVKHGPFKGMQLADRSSEGCYIAKLIGVYEQPLWPVLETVIARDYEVVLNVGASEGFYAVGMALRMPKSTIIGYERDPAARRLLESLIRANGVEGRVTSRAAMSPESFSAYDGKRVLVLCDIEGEEFSLFSGAVPDILRNSDLIIEAHETAEAPGVAAQLAQRFQSTHEIVLIEDNGMRSFDGPSWFKRLPHMDQLLCSWEWRSSPTPWLFMTARGQKT